MQHRSVLDIGAFAHHDRPVVPTQHGVEPDRRPGLDGDVAAVRFLRLLYVGPKLLFLVASVDLAGDAPESDVAKKLRRLERELESDPHIVDAVLTIADPDESDSN